MTDQPYTCDTDPGLEFCRSATEGRGCLRHQEHRTEADSVRMFGVLPPEPPRPDPRLPSPRRLDEYKCTCPSGPAFEGPQVDCDVHGLPSAAYAAGQASATVPYDSTLDTLKHQRRVDQLLVLVIEELTERLCQHDESKMHEPEKSTFDRVTGRLQGLTYGTDEYRQALADMGPALDHHYIHNRHHPEHFSRGVAGMTLVDLVEMLCDWKAATERHADGDLTRSLPHNASRFGYVDQALEHILWNTARELGWITSEEAGDAG